MNSQQAAATSQVNNVLKNRKRVQFAMLFPVIKSLLDEDRAMQLTTLYDRLKKRKISKDVFEKHMRGLVADHILKLAFEKLQEQASRSSQVATHQVASQTQFLARQQHMNSSPRKHIQNSERSTSAVDQESNRRQDPSSISQYLQSQKMNTQQAAATSQASDLKNGQHVPFAILYPVIEPLIDKDKAMQLRTIYNGLKKRNICKDVIVKHMRGLVGDHILKLAVTKLQEQASRSSQVATQQVATHQVASHTQFLVQPQHMNSSPQSLKQQPQNTLVKLQTKVDELTKEKIDLGNLLTVALSEVESLLAQKSSWDKERTVLEDKVKNWIARAVIGESSNSELASQLQTCEAIYKAKLEELQSVHNAEVKKLPTKLEEVSPDFVKSMDEAVPSFQDGYSTTACADKFAASGVDVTGKLFVDCCAELDSSLFINAP